MTGGRWTGDRMGGEWFLKGATSRRCECTLIPNGSLAQISRYLTVETIPPVRPMTFLYGLCCEPLPGRLRESVSGYFEAGSITIAIDEGRCQYDDKPAT